MDNVNGPDDEIGIDPLPLPNIPVPRAAVAVADWARRQWLAFRGRRPTRRGWLVAAVATAVVLVGALKLSGLIWTSAPPAWVPALGPGVTVTGPEQVAPGHGSPGAVLAGALAALSAKDPALLCDYEYSSVAQCEEQYGHVSSRQLPYKVSAKIGYVAIEGTRALVGFTGTVCSQDATPRCIMNADPAAVFSAGNTFEVLWSQTLSPTSSGAYGLLPCFEVNGKWYLGAGPTQSNS
jgi:hypothetical protein